LHGGGQVILSDDDHNVISGTASNVVLDNVDNRISGAGQIGGAQLTLKNEGMIDATGTHALMIDTGANTIVNSGTLEASGAGGLVINSAVDNSGTLWAHGGNLFAMGEVTGSGSALISGTATLEFGAISTANVTLDADAIGTVILGDSIRFGASIKGFNGDDHLDLLDIEFDSGASVSYTANGSGNGGTLSVSDGTHTANIALLGQYDPGGFHEIADSKNGALITYDPFHLV
jgi:hypothetical protein